MIDASHATTASTAASRIVRAESEWYKNKVDSVYFHNIFSHFSMCWMLFWNINVMQRLQQ